MKKITGLTLIGLMISFALFAQGQFPSQMWHKGQIVTADNSVYRGLVKYDLDNNVVQLQTDKAVQTFGSSNVFQFEIFDEVYGGVRTFYSLPFSLNAGDYETPVFFEILTEGDDIALLCREHIVTDNRNMGMGMGPMMMNPMWGHR
ncbi:hypothetical protein A3SI_00130 [Nitritalea halalkaliphila LW7]|uniref:Uncharacterized protein n=1 Tax=Nitritalea halalkaliphila LW7 TaxID=1189621 RepID=I5CAJ0_9BACT|nr:hypothetical protein [Nitritalea halalkaliphila]EIM78842.1 hypothetical protein A3SI_00130 [Nitritalea halalkaliphila LW7]